MSKDLNSKSWSGTKANFSSFFVTYFLLEPFKVSFSIDEALCQSQKKRKTRLKSFRCFHFSLVQMIKEN